MDHAEEKQPTAASPASGGGGGSSPLAIISYLQKPAAVHVQQNQRWCRTRQEEGRAEEGDGGREARREGGVSIVKGGVGWRLMPHTTSLPRFWVTLVAFTSSPSQIDDSYSPLKPSGKEFSLMVSYYGKRGDIHHARGRLKESLSSG